MFYNQHGVCMSNPGSATGFTHTSQVTVRVIVVEIACWCTLIEPHYN